MSKREKAERIAKWAEQMDKLTGTGRKANRRQPPPPSDPKHPPGENPNPAPAESPESPDRDNQPRPPLTPTNDTTEGWNNPPTPSGVPIETSEWPPETKKRVRKTNAPKAETNTPRKETSAKQKPHTGASGETSPAPRGQVSPPRKTRAKGTRRQPPTPGTVSIDTKAQEPSSTPHADSYADPSCACGRIPKQPCPVHPVAYVPMKALPPHVEPVEAQPADEPVNKSQPEFVHTSEDQAPEGDDEADEPPVEGSVDPPLTAKQARFVEEYVVDFNATAAARRAGYAKTSAEHQGWENLRKPEIARAIAAHREKLSQDAEIRATDIVRELAKMGFANLADYHGISADGEPYIDLSSCTRAQLAALQDVSVEDFLDGRGEDARMVRRVKIKIADKARALAQLADILGFSSKRKIELSGEVKVEAKKDERLKERIRRMDTDELRAYLELHERMESLLKGNGDQAAETPEPAATEEEAA